MTAATLERPTINSTFLTRSASATLITMLITDFLAMSLAAVTSTLLSRTLPADVGLAAAPSYWLIGPLPVLSMLAFSIFGLYPGVAINPVTEVRNIVNATTITYLVVAVTSLCLRRESASYGTALFFAWLSTVFFTLVARHTVRNWLHSKPWWGVPAIVIGDATATNLVARALRKNGSLGLRLIGALQQDSKSDEIVDVPVLGRLEMASTLASDHGIRYAILAMPGIPSSTLKSLVEQHLHSYEHLLIIPDMFGMESLSVGAKDLGGVLGLEVRQTRLHASKMIPKRAFDIVMALLIGIVTLPLMAIIYVCVRVSSPGPAFYGGPRVGRNGVSFTAWKFRSMVLNAEDALHREIAANPERKAEWQRACKLKNDPRITKVGKFLRRTSLDELPQIWNILVGHMSLVGPRPISAYEILKYGESLEFYQRVRPGLTGLWQVSGRSDTTFDERISYDEYYVRNWSMWLDVYILSKTAHAVFLSQGAY